MEEGAFGGLVATFDLISDPEYRQKFSPEVHTLISITRNGAARV